MKQDIFEAAKRELLNGTVKKRYPFRYFSLATLNKDQPVQRTVVLRRFYPNLSFLVYTDLRSQKVAELSINNSVSALFYHPKQLLQIKLEGKANIISDTDEIHRIWKGISENNRKDYITESAPGTVIKNPDEVTYNMEIPHFCMIHIHPEFMEYLQLKRPNHIRLRYTKTNKEWKGDFIVP